jgi:ribosomal protein S3AE
MSITFSEILENLSKCEETFLLELLDIHSEEIVERFEDIIELRQEYIRSQLFEDDENIETLDR